MGSGRNLARRLRAASGMKPAMKAVASHTPSRTSACDVRTGTDLQKGPKLLDCEEQPARMADVQCIGYLARNGQRLRFRGGGDDVCCSERLRFLGVGRAKLQTAAAKPHRSAP